MILYGEKVFGGRLKSSWNDLQSLARQLAGDDRNYELATLAFWHGVHGDGKIADPRICAIFAQDVGAHDPEQLRSLPPSSPMTLLDFSVIGVGALFTLPLLTERVGRIESVVVNDAYRGRGIGKEITLRLIAKAKKLGLEAIDLTSNPSRAAANALYQKLGFERYDTNVYRLKLK